ncbi:hypothetical protein MMC14_010566 [Varicellaria rhodocarpa]|nr:hypothetical protein [Varicellaria rhodocarpa]
MSPSISSSALIAKTTVYVKEYMSMHDASHDYTHIERLLALASRILHAEQTTNPNVSYDPTIIILGCLMHDVGDRNYRSLPQRATEDPNTIIAITLISFGRSSILASYVQTIALNVSHFHKMNNRVSFQNVLQTHPELAIVQDADRLDSLGATGVQRILTFSEIIGRGLEDTLAVFAERMYSLTEKMKTAEGRRLSVVRTERCRLFEGWCREDGGVGRERYRQLDEWYREEVGISGETSDGKMMRRWHM